MEDSYLTSSAVREKTMGLERVDALNLECVM